MTKVYDEVETWDTQRRVEILEALRALNLDGEQREVAAGVFGAKFKDSGTPAEAVAEFMDRVRSGE